MSPGKGSSAAIQPSPVANPAAAARLAAEGVETDAEAARLRGLGAEFGQGYLFGRPKPAEAWAASAAPPQQVRLRK